MPPPSTSTQSRKTPLRRTAPSVLKPSIRSLAMIIGSCPVLMTTTLFLADGSSTALFEGSIVADFAYPSNHRPALRHLCDPRRQHLLEINPGCHRREARCLPGAIASQEAATLSTPFFHNYRR